MGQCSPRLAPATRPLSLQYVGYRTHCYAIQNKALVICVAAVALIHSVRLSFLLCVSDSALSLRPRTIALYRAICVKYSAVATMPWLPAALLARLAPPLLLTQYGRVSLAAAALLRWFHNNDLWPRNSRHRVHHAK
uniref:Uncharacterized protein n=1 Tax=Heliothis virescens TaxID=7102 RepID=A0A2A4J9A6_HELVI